MALLLSGAAPAAAGTVAILQGLDKTTARISRIEAPVDQPVHFGTLIITVRACVKRPPEEPPETSVFLIIDEARPGGTSFVTRRVFSGWMFASSPAVSAMEDPIYDVTVLDCKTILAMPCHAMPCHAMPCHAMPCQALVRARRRENRRRRRARGRGGGDRRRG